MMEGIGVFRGHSRGIRGLSWGIVEAFGIRGRLVEG